MESTVVGEAMAMADDMESSIPPCAAAQLIIRLTMVTSFNIFKLELLAVALAGVTELLLNNVVK